MSDTVGRAALTIGGAVVFGPVGAVVGGILGDVLFPVEAGKGPRLNELNVQRSTVGAPIQIRYGTCKGAGNVIWSGGLRETEHEGESAGKGGPKGPANYTYSIDLAIGICAGEDGTPSQPAGIRRLWADADLIYDSSSDEVLTERLELGGVSPGDIADFITGIRAASAQLNFVFYDGSEDQLPDPTIESYEGVGNVPGFRGLAHIVLPAFQLERFGNRIPNFTIETYSGAPTECGIYSPGVLYPWIEGGRDPRDHDYLETYSYRYASGTWRTTFAEAVADAEAGSGRQLFTNDVNLHGWRGPNNDNVQSPCDGISTNDFEVLYLLYNVVDTSQRTCDVTGPGSNFCDVFKNVYGVGQPVWLPGSQHGLHVVVADGEDEEQYFNGYSGSGVTSCLDSDHYITDIGDVQIQVTRSIQPPDDYLYTWTQVAGTFHVLQEYDATGGGNSVVTAYPLGPAVVSTDPNYNNQAYWEAAYAEALAAGAMLNATTPMPGDWVYGVDYPDTQSFAYLSECTAVATECVPMATIVADICRRAGLRTDTATQIDVSGLTTCVIGYIVGRQMSARDALAPLRLFGLWDAVETDALLKFVERGAAIVATLTTDDLGAHENGSQAPTAVEVSRVQEKDLPRRVRLHFANYLHDHEASEQSASRITTEAIDELDLELPISMEPDTAKQLAEIALYAQWVGRNTQRFSLDNNWLALEPTDCVELPIDGQTERVRIVAVDYSIGGILKIDAVRDDDGSYVSTAVATPSQPSGGVPGGPGSALICPTEMVLLDIPRLNNAHIDAGYYAAVYATPGCQSWACAEIYRSSDGGATYGRVARTDQETTVGEIVTITGPTTDPTLPGDSPAYDTSSAITVTLFEGTLSSVTDAQIAAGQNVAAIGLDGRWVIVQFKTATLDTGDTWILTDLVWGLLDTQHLLGTTVDGDTFVLLNDPALLRIPETAANIGVEKQLKAVTCGQSIDDADAQNFTTWGLSYLRLCPSSVISATVTDPPVSPTDGDAYLLPNDTSLSGVWADHGGEIAHWSDETDSWVFCTPVPGTIIRIGADSSTDPGDDSVISDGDGTYSPGVWTPAIPPLSVIDTTTDLDTSYFVVYTLDGYRKVLGTDVGTGTGGGGDVTGPGGVSTDNAIARWDGTTGDALKNSATILDNSDVVSTPNASAAEVGFKGIPQNSQTTNYTLVLGDAGKCIYKGSGGTITVTIPANSSVAFPIGTSIEGINDDTETLTIAITTDTLVMYRTGATGSRSVAARGYWQIRKVDTTRWYIGGDGVT